MMSGYTIDGNSSETLLTRTLPLTDMYTREEMYGNGSIHFKHLRHKIQDFLVVSAADGSLGSVRRNEPPNAQECVITGVSRPYDPGILSAVTKKRSPTLSSI